MAVKKTERVRPGEDKQIKSEPEKEQQVKIS